jgi:enoyl-CoA hydratase/carnithine racemase
VPIDAATAADWGLVNEVVPADRLEARTLELAGQIAAASSVVTGIGKEAFYAQIDRDQHSAYDYAKTVMTMNALADDAQEGICAFLEKRTPSWSDR